MEWQEINTKETQRALSQRISSPDPPHQKACRWAKKRQKVVKVGKVALSELGRKVNHVEAQKKKTYIQEQKAKAVLSLNGQELHKKENKM